MSKFLVVLYNGTKENIRFRNKEYLFNNKYLPAGTMFTTKVHFNVPDYSGEGDFNLHHMEVLREDSSLIFRFWSDANNKHTLMYCSGTDWLYRSPMLGTAHEGDGKNVGIVLTGSYPNYQITSCHVQHDV